jgi:hypothetical protein
MPTISPVAMMPASPSQKKVLALLLPRSMLWLEDYSGLREPGFYRSCCAPRAATCAIVPAVVIHRAMSFLFARFAHRPNKTAAPSGMSPCIGLERKI